MFAILSLLIVVLHRYAGSLRKHLFREHLGEKIVLQPIFVCCRISTGRRPLSWHGPSPFKEISSCSQPGLFETFHQDLDITDPTSDRLEHIWYKHARQHGHANNYCAIMIDIEIDFDCGVWENLNDFRGKYAGVENNDNKKNKRTTFFSIQFLPSFFHGVWNATASRNTQLFEELFSVVFLYELLRVILQMCTVWSLIKK